MSPETKIDVRIDADLKNHISHAATLDGLKLSQFVREAALQRADEIIAHHVTFTTVPSEFFNQMIDALDVPNSALRRAAKRADHTVTQASLSTSTCLVKGMHDLDPFASGEPDLDEWLKSHAAESDAKRITRTFVWLERRNETVVAYYSRRGHKAVRDVLPSKPACGNPLEVPAVLLARLALDLSLHGSGYGGELLVDALRRVVAATTQVAARFVMVDALHEPAAAFYEHHGFTRVPGDLRLLRTVSAIEKDVTA